MGLEDLTEIKQEFNRLLELWTKHCYSNGIRTSPDPRRFRDSDAYKGIVALGIVSPKIVLQLIYETYSGTDDKAFFALWDWAYAVEEITQGQFKIPWYTTEGPIRGDTRKIRDYTVEWLTEHLNGKQ